MNVSLRKVATIAVGTIFLAVLLTPEAEGAPRRVRGYRGGGGGGVAGAAAIGIGAGIIGAAIGNAIANGQRPVRTRRPAAKQTEEPQTAVSNDAQVPTDERVNAPLVTQYTLAALGFYDSAITGRMNKETVLAIGKWQQQKELEVTGRLTARQFEMLRGSIVVIQQRLERLGFDPGPSDGNVTQRLRQSVQRFQTRLGVRADGYLTVNEHEKLIAMDNIRATVMAMDRVFEKIAKGSGAAAPAGDKPKGDQAIRVASMTELVNFKTLCRETPAEQPFKLSADPEPKGKPDPFCLTRSQAIEEGSAIFKSLAARTKAITMDVVRAECERFAESKRQEIAALAQKDPKVLAVELAKTMPADPRQREIAIGNAKVCLGFGYADDKPEVTLGSTLFLVGLGQTGYAEVVASHFALGVGAPKDSAKAAAWIEFTAAELEAGKAPAVKVDAKQRALVLRALSDELKTTQNAGFGPQFSLAALPLAPLAQDKAAPQGSGNPGYVSALEDNSVFIWTGMSFGTGFFIAPNLILTNDHVVRGFDRVLLASKSLPLNVQRGKVLFRGKSSDRSDDTGIDAAVIEVEGYKHPTFLRFAPERPQIGRFVAVGGFPGQSLDYDRGFKEFKRVFFDGDLPLAEQLPHLTVSTGGVQSFFTDAGTGRERMQQSAQAGKGNSGSAIVNACGQVVALLDAGSIQSVQKVQQQGYIEGTVFVWTFTAREVTKFLDTAKVSYNVAEEPCTVSPAGTNQ